MLRCFRLRYFPRFYRRSWISTPDRNRNPEPFNKRWILIQEQCAENGPPVYTLHWQSSCWASQSCRGRLEAGDRWTSGSDGSRGSQAVYTPRFPLPVLIDTGAEDLGP
ncbi:hypothetical protein AAFF_G00140920 [Aldrovandia affinis]|uniref:Uncharacterized protein n=1 Tax=Aldrovandia affinis TaxID=143900 RepID=A0AAD7TDR2_9TELE|nr:hypothetical protein AAFF_G00140920 [Aldrovandia affinis]